MKTSFACPSCGAAGAADAAFAGRQVRCKHCGHRFPIPDDDGDGDGDGPEGDAYALDEPARVATTSPPRESVFVTPRGDEPPASPSAPPRRSKPTRPAGGTTARSREADLPWRTWLARGGVVALIALAAVALIAPSGVLIVGNVLLALGSGMVVVGYFAGAYGAFCEDFLYGVLYLGVPLYTAYYLVTRWDDLWVWFACSTAGVAVVLLGTGLVQWAGGPA